MKQVITTEAVRGWQKAPPGAEVDVYDAKQPRLVLRLRPNGKHAYRVLLGRGKWFTLGGTELTPVQAREEARKRLGDVARGIDPQAEKKKTRQPTLRAYLEKTYTPWLVAHRKTGANIAAELLAAFAPLEDLALDAITPWQIEKWRRDRLASVSAATTNRDLSYLKAMLARAVEWGHVATHPIAKVKKLPEDTTGRLRFLSPDEETRLLAALTARDTRAREERASANAWRRARGYATYPELGAYPDLLTPIVTVALHTGLRFGELTGLCWRDVDLTRKLLTVVTESAKSGRARHVPLNAEAVRVLTAWRPDAADVDAYVFPGEAGERLVDVKTAWARVLKAAKVTAFRFHDLRHTFASKLVMAGVDLNTVRELLGHADITMTLRYAHLAPEHKAAAVAKLLVSA